MMKRVLRLTLAVFAVCFVGVTSASAAVLATATLDPPHDSTSIAITVKNLTASSSIDTVTIDCFRAKHREGLTIKSTSSTPPPAGTSTVKSTDRGPAIVSYTGFGPGESVVITLDPDTWDNASFAATHEDMIGCNVEISFSGDLRGAGMMNRAVGDFIRARVLTTHQ
jgi:hypothetical protein